jgi:anti-sigma factor RsiW
MNTGTAHLGCPPAEIAAYLDGELDQRREAELEAHIAGCATCHTELNEQRRFLCTLTAGLKQEAGLELPPEFAKRVVANAESTVAGLRRPRERFNAVFICAALGLFGLFALGPDANRVIGVTLSLVDQLAAVGGFVGRLVYALFVGVAVVLRSAAAPFESDKLVLVAIGLILGVLVVFASHRGLRILRA